MQDRPTLIELLEAVRGFLEREIVPGIADPRLAYQALIAVNALRIAEREAAGEEARLRAELRALEDLLGLPPAAPPADPAGLRRRVAEANRELCGRIRRGDADAGPRRERVLAHVRLSVEEKLRISNPAQLGALLAGEGA